jgi:hypothetical protein
VAVHRTAKRLDQLLVDPMLVVVEGAQASEFGDAWIHLSRELRFVVVSRGVEGDEGWRLFTSGSDKSHSQFTAER